MSCGVERADHRHARKRVGEGERDVSPASAADQRRGSPALTEPVLCDEHCQAGGEEVDRDARDQLVAAERDRGEPVHEAQQHGGEDARTETEPHRTRDRGDRGGKEGGDQHLAFEADVDDAGALGEEPREAGEQKRRCQPHRRVRAPEGGCCSPYGVPPGLILRASCGRGGARRTSARAASGPCCRGRR